MSNLLPRCEGICRDGTRCGRRVRDGVLCKMHDGGPHPSPMIRAQQEAIADEDEMTTLRKLAKDRDARVRLRAVDLLISLRNKEVKKCAACAARRNEIAYAQHLSDAQIAEVKRISIRLNVIKAAALEAAQQENE